MFLDAGLNSDGIQNHSLRATGISRLYSKGIPEKAIMDRSGHQSAGGVRSYERSTAMQEKEISTVIASSKGLQEKPQNTENTAVVATVEEKKKL